MDSDNTPTTSPVPALPPSLIRAAEHLKAKFQELPWFIAVAPTTVAGRFCLVLDVRDHGIPRGMVLPTSFETFTVVINKVGISRHAPGTRKSGPTPLW
jgi:hypothetical protein